MATITRYQNPSLAESIITATYTFDFVQAVVVLEKLYPAYAKFSETFSPDLESLSIKSHVSMSPLGSELYKVEIQNKKPTLWINFLSIAGVLGPLPTPYTEKLLQEKQKKNTAFQDFIDIFNHRLASLWYRHYKKVHFTSAYVLPYETMIGQCLLQIAGVTKTNILKDRSLNERMLLTYQRLFWKKPHNLMGLKKIIESYFGVKVYIEDLQGKWRKAQDTELTRIGSYKGNYHKLGQNVILGSRCWDQMAGIFIQFGPLSWDQYLKFKPSYEQNSLYQQLKELTHYYVGLDTDITVEFILSRYEAKPTLLGKSAHLGFNTWLKPYHISSAHLSAKAYFGSLFAY